ncbi:MAG: TrbI/VirB10 family protein [Cytophagales bacterium]|nr:TrbI/VirB10 family protein [Cytophagales bacterium]
MWSKIKGYFFKPDDENKLKPTVTMFVASGMVLALVALPLLSKLGTAMARKGRPAPKTEDTQNQSIMLMAAKNTERDAVRERSNFDSDLTSDESSSNMLMNQARKKQDEMLKETPKKKKTTKRRSPNQNTNTSRTQKTQGNYDDKPQAPAFINDDSPIVFDNKDKLKTPYVIPKYTRLTCMTMHNIVTNNTLGRVEVALIQPVEHGGRRLLPIFARIFGEVSAGQNRDRAEINFDTIRLLDGTVIPFQGKALNHDESMGVQGMLINPVSKKFYLQTLTSFTSGALLSLQETETNQVTGTETLSNNSRNAILEGLSASTNDQVTMMKDELAALKPYLVIPKETYIKIEIQAELDVGSFLQKTHFEWKGTRRAALWYKDF